MCEARINRHEQNQAALQPLGATRKGLSSEQLLHPIENAPSREQKHSIPFLAAAHPSWICLLYTSDAADE